MRDIRIGVVGGVGPLAGVELQRLIIEATPAEVDQDHLQVITFTNPSIPDRTRSLAEDNGELYVRATTETAQVLERAGADVIAIPCMTAHARHADIQAGLRVPLLHAVSLTQAHLRSRFPGQTVALMATDGSVNSRVYTSGNHGINWLLPTADQQRQIMGVIYGIKAGETKFAAAKLRPVMDQLRSAGAQVFVLGCTELGLLFSELGNAGFILADPLRILASELVGLSQAPDDSQFEAESDAIGKPVKNTPK
jgi:aspartate racemase